MESTLSVLQEFSFAWHEKKSLKIGINLEVNVNYSSLKDSRMLLDLMKFMNFNADLF